MEADYCPSGLLVSGSKDTTIKVWDLRTKTAIQTYSGHNSSINDVQVSPDGLWVASSCSGKVVNIWDIKNKQVVNSFDFHNAPVTCIKFNPEELALSVAGEEKFATYYTLENKFEVLGKTQRESTPVTALEFDHAGEYLFTATSNNLRVWDTKNMKLVNTFEAKWSSVQDLSIADNNSTIYATAVKGNNFQMWVSDPDSNPKSRNNQVLSSNKNYVNVASNNNNKMLDETCFAQITDSIIGEDTKKFEKDFEMIKKIESEHSKFVDLMSDKINYLKPILHWLHSNQPEAALNAIDK